MRHDELRRDGLEVRLGYSNHGGFVSFTVEILRGIRLRDHTPHQLHISICYTGDVDDALLEDMGREWHGKTTHLDIVRCGSGGTAFLGDCPFSLCPKVQRVYKAGWFGKRGLHISF